MSMPVRALPQEPSGKWSSSSMLCWSGRKTLMLPVTSPNPKYCTRHGPSFCSARFWSARYIGAPA